MVTWSSFVQYHMWWWRDLIVFKMLSDADEIILCEKQSVIVTWFNFAEKDMCDV